jgi:hypothetical protein
VTQVTEATVRKEEALDDWQEVVVAQNRRAVLRTLRAELVFLESGGYRHPSHAAWRPQFVFEDSPTCLNRDPAAPRKPCSECALAQFLPKGLGVKRIPCRYIPLNEGGATIDSFYRTGTREELESAVGGWLKATIERLDREEAEELHAQERSEIHVKAKFASPE